MFNDQGFAVSASAQAKGIDTLYYPKDIVGEIGMSKQRIAFLKNKGCLFYGRKTCIRWVREHITAEALGAVSSEQLSQHRQN